MFAFLFFSLLMFQNSSVDSSPDCGSAPTLNQNIIGFVKSQLNKKVGRGECWDLAANALNTHKAKWDGLYKYGRKVDPSSECVYAGDIVQFEKVVMEYNTSDGKMMEEMPHHTAVIYKVESQGQYIIAHQNYNYNRKVVLTPINLANIKKGKAMIYRPQN